MYNLEDIKSVHLEVTSKCQASCPMCARNIQGGIENPLISLDEITLDQFKEWFPEDFITNLDRLYMCGNLGDPIIAKDTLSIFEYLRSVNPNMLLSMNTNGSARTSSFWKGLANVNVKVCFGIDGLKDTHSLYRVGTDYSQITRNASEFIAAGGDAEWHMLIFKHNEHQIEECRNTSVELGFTKFVAKNTARFKDDQLNVLDKSGKTTHILYPTDKSKNIVIKVQEAVITKINCKVKQQGSLYISASGYVSPCCWLDNKWMPPNTPNRIDYMDQIGQHPNLHETSLASIFKQAIFKQIEQTWTTCSPLKECSKQCGEVDRFNEQFK